MRRREDWELKLEEHIQARAAAPFAWGKNDCALFVCDGIEAMTGADVAGEFRGQYSTLASAVVRMQQVTHGTSVADVADYVAKQQSFPELASVLFAQRGDVVLFEGTEGPAIGLVSLDGLNAVFVGPEGLRRIPVNACERAWRI